MQHSADESARTSRLWDALGLLLTVLLALLVAHDVDHVVNESRLGELSALFWVFLPFQYATYLAVIALVWRRNEAGPGFAAALSAISIIGFAGAHLVPFGPLPYSEGDPLAISWALVYVPMAVAAATLAVALRLWSLTRRTGGVRAASV
jgi:hypothetical protein